MTFTAATIKKLRALGLDDAMTDKVLEIFEEAKLSRPKNGSAVDRQARGSRLPEDWVLPAEWREWSMSIGMRMGEVDRERTKFKNYWLNCASAKGIKLKWDLTWQTWCLRMLEQAGRTPIQPPDGSASGGEGPGGFDDATWAAISKRFKAGASWSPDWGPSPESMGCLMPVEYL